MQHIDHYSFGKMTINGRTYTADVIIYPDRTDSSWWRQEGHYLQKADLREILRERPDILVIGTGKHGVMKVSEDALSLLQEAGIEVFIEKTDAAAELFNSQPEEKKVVGAFHLTC